MAIHISHISEAPLDNTPFINNLSEKQKEVLNQFLTVPDEALKFLQPIIMQNASEKGVSIESITLRLAQLRPVAMSYVNPRFFIGDKPGLGKTVMSAACVALYQSRERKAGREPKKVLVITDTSHVKGFAKEWASFGIPLMQFGGGKAQIKRALKKQDISEFDGVILNWDTLKSNTFIEFYMKHHELFGIAVFDETSKLLNPKSAIYKMTDLLVNHYQGGIERVIFLNGSSFEKNIFDFYYQFSILSPKLIPSKSFLEKHFVIREGREGTETDYYMNGSYMHVKHSLMHSGEIVDYKNQEVLRDKLKYYYIARSKSDYSKDIPQHSYILRLIPMTTKQQAAIKKERRISLINSPATSEQGADMSRKALPKLDFLLNYISDVIQDRPLIYVFNLEAQQTVASELMKLGYRVAIINGDQSINERDNIITAFNEGNLDCLVFNIRKAINIPTSERIIFWDIPTMPQQTSQIIGRIDRNNYTQGKFYDFLCYMNSPEMENMVRLAYFRETQAAAFTGQVETVYATLQRQLEFVLERDLLVEANDVLAQVEEGELNYEQAAPLLDNLLHI